jgi:hypothetical protein
VERLPDDPAWEAIADRLRRAATIPAAPEPPARRRTLLPE